MNKQDQQQIRREEILNAAKEVFSNTGFHQADVSEIAKIANIAKGTVYLYYPTKKALFLAVIELGLERLASEIKNKLQDINDPHEKIKIAIKTYMLFFKNNQKFYRILVHPDLELLDEIAGTFKDVKLAKLPQMTNIINKGIEQKIIRSIDAESLSYIILGMVDFILFQWLLDPEKETIEQKVNQVYEVLFRGILNE
jgi:AcrR family transcriptional regulator